MNRSFVTNGGITLLAIAVVLAVNHDGFAESTTQAATQASTRPSMGPLIVLAGDSGVTDEHGWGIGFAHGLAGGARCLNLSASGRSSKSYRDDGYWGKVLGSHPNYILINFGGNDQAGKGPERETDPNTTYKANISRYVDEARAIGAKPIIIAPMCRRFFNKSGEIHSSLQPYVDVLTTLASEKQAPFIDLHQQSIDYFQKVGSQVSDAEFSPITDGRIDRSHLTSKGGEIVGQLVINDLGKQVPDLVPFLRIQP